ncbi:MAG: hypothetical protein HGB16_00460, partial [Chlorobaculum sp.]|nr:hypothetical protein [Chlorobaculum sp.]
MSLLDFFDDYQNHSAGFFPDKPEGTTDPDSIHDPEELLDLILQLNEDGLHEKSLVAARRLE